LERIAARRRAAPLLAGLALIALPLVALPLIASGPVQAGQKELRKEFVQQGEASFYGPGFRGRKTATGERFDPSKMTAAHRSLPLGTEATVTNLENGKKVEVEINDRGPHAKARVLDLSTAAAKRLDMIEDGTAQVRIRATPRQQDGKYGRDDDRKPEAVAER
jgi:rare lipoprotein A (peptidoglycan hydrolase)